MHVFIVRPFDKKVLAKRDKNTGKVIEEILFDFDRIEEELIAPALKSMNLQGGTTGKIFESGDIREDMFSQLLQADIVIADITMHNANVFYELGIRHALRDKMTILIKSPGFEDTPFDILGYRYVDYSRDDPGASLPKLIHTIKDTLKAERKDSPVFNLLPELEVQDTEKMLALPQDFIEEVEIAAGSGQLGKLSLLAAEVEGFAWKYPALRLVGEKLYKMKAIEASRSIWEKIKAFHNDDVEANDRLATIYQRLAENEMETNPMEGEALLVQSDLAIERLLKKNLKLSDNKRAEAFSLKGRNAKTRWIQSWKKSDESLRCKDALSSGYLLTAYKNYEKGYFECLNHYYSGINALVLLTILTSLAKANPDVWESSYDTQEAADYQLRKYMDKCKAMAVSLKFALDVEKSKQDEKGKTDPWLSITEADYACLISSKPQLVNSLYKKALDGSNNLTIDATRRQLKILEQLNVMTENVKEALKNIPGKLSTNIEAPMQYLLFTGHMIDKPDRKKARFPAHQEKNVKQKIKDEITKVKGKINGGITGIAGGACGGDILFHEICEELNIPTELYLALPREMFLLESVQYAGPDWVDRFDKLYKKLSKHILSQTRDLPKWLQKKDNYTIWERNNLWELNSALINGGINMTFVALWDGKGGDGPGGTSDMVKEARAKGAKTVIIAI